MTTPYRAHPALNWSRLAAIARSPAHYRHALAHPVEPTPAMVLGTLAHLATLEADVYAATVLVAPAKPDGRTKLGKAAQAGRAALDDALSAAKAAPDDLAALLAYAEHVDRVAAGGVTVATEAQDETARAIAAAVHAHPLASLLLSEADAEVPMYWDEAGTPCKGLIDALVREPSDALRWALGGTEPGAIVADLKTVGTGLDRLADTSARRMWHGQLAHYAAGVEASGYPVAARVIVAVEPSAPYDVVVGVMTPETCEAGDALRARLMRTLAACEASGEWPGMAPAATRLGLPRWAAESDDDVDPDAVEW